MPGTKTIRRSIIALWDDGDATLTEELDRVMIAFYRFQTEGRVAYRRIVGMHGGGGGTSSPEFKAILKEKAKRDVGDHYEQSDLDNAVWPGYCTNFPIPQPVNILENPFAYNFCWHGHPEFLLWHRGLMAEFERNLQEYDPKYKGTEPVHDGPEALGVPYWGWEGWDGHTLPHQFTDATYTVRTDKWKNAGYPAGSTFSNPFRRWYAPVSFEDQESETFPPLLDETNCTTRALSFEHPEVKNSLLWNVPGVNRDLIVVKIIFQALAEPNFFFFGTVNKDKGSNKSIESPHNRFHNRIGGFTLGGTRGPGKQESDDAEFTGTMAQNQSIFDPIFWLHHGNVERQFCSWQKHWIWDVAPENRRPESIPTEKMDVVLYPWTKPEKLAQNQYSWNTPADAANDATFKDLWDFGENLTYEYDDLLPVITPEQIPKQAHLLSAFGVHTINVSQPGQKRLRLTAHLNSVPRGGEYTLYLGGEPVSTVNILNAFGFGCARCQKKANAVSFEVTDFIRDPENPDLSAFSLRKLFADTAKELVVTKWELSDL